MEGGRKRSIVFSTQTASVTLTDPICELLYRDDILHRLFKNPTYMPSDKLYITAVNIAIPQINALIQKVGINLEIMCVYSHNCVIYTHMQLIVNCRFLNVFKLLLSSLSLYFIKKMKKRPGFGTFAYNASKHWQTLLGKFKTIKSHNVFKSKCKIRLLREMYDQLSSG